MRNDDGTEKRYDLSSDVKNQIDIEDILGKRIVAYYSEIDREITTLSVSNLKTFKLDLSKELVKIVAIGVDDAKALLEKYENSLVYLTLKLDRPLSELESKELFGNYPQLVDYKLETTQIKNRENQPSRKELNDKELFESYYFSKYGERVPEEIITLYLKAMLGEEV